MGRVCGVAGVILLVLRGTASAGVAASNTPPATEGPASSACALLETEGDCRNHTQCHWEVPFTGQPRCRSGGNAIPSCRAFSGNGTECLNHACDYNITTGCTSMCRRLDGSRSACAAASMTDPVGRVVTCEYINEYCYQKTPTLIGDCSTLQNASMCADWGTHCLWEEGACVDACSTTTDCDRRECAHARTFTPGSVNSSVCARSVCQMQLSHAECETADGCSWWVSECHSSCDFYTHPNCPDSCERIRYGYCGPRLWTPATTSPGTRVPATEAPATAIPATAVPDTQAPPTPAPATASPPSPTSVPAVTPTPATVVIDSFTAASTTTAPATALPATEGPASSACALLETEGDCRTHTQCHWEVPFTGQPRCRSGGNAVAECYGMSTNETECLQYACDYNTTAITCLSMCRRLDGSPSACAAASMTDPVGRVVTCEYNEKWQSCFQKTPSLTANCSTLQNASMCADWGSHCLWEEGACVDACSTTTDCDSRGCAWGHAAGSGSVCARSVCQMQLAMDDCVSVGGCWWWNDGQCLSDCAHQKATDCGEGCDLAYTPSPTCVPRMWTAGTTSPATRVPATEGPAVTPIPATASTTIAPATAVIDPVPPTTAAPATSSPATTVPATAVIDPVPPSTDAPATASAATPAPATTIPATEVIDPVPRSTTAPATTVPATAVIDPVPPSTDAPATGSPVTTLPRGPVPTTAAPAFATSSTGDIHWGMWLLAVCGVLALVVGATATVLMLLRQRAVPSYAPHNEDVLLKSADEMYVPQAPQAAV